MLNHDGPIMRLLSMMGQIIIVTCLWLICCIPIVTVAGATASMYYALIKSIRRGRGYPYREFFRSFKRTLLSGIVITILFAAIAIMLYFGRIYANDLGSVRGIMLFLAYDVLAVIAGGTFLFSCINLSRFYMKTGTLIKFSLLMTLKHLPVTLVLTAVPALLICGYVYWKLPLMTLLIAPGVCCYITTYLVEPVLKKYMKTPEKTENNEKIISGEDAWYYES